MAYIHGYDPAEQRRLVEQAKFHYPSLFEVFDFRGVRSLLEVGCGVGAQTKLLLKQNSKMKILGIDRSDTQLATAQRYLKGEKRVALMKVSDTPWELPSGSFDAAYICWVLEHAEKPLELLRECRRVLKKGGKVFITEVYNRSLALNPELPAFQDLWQKASTLQAQFGGDPQVGSKLAMLLDHAGFSKKEIQPYALTFSSKPTRHSRATHAYWRRLTESVVPQLKEAGLITDDQVKQALMEFDSLLKHPEGNFFYTPIQATAWK